MHAARYQVTAGHLCCIAKNVGNRYSFVSDDNHSKGPSNHSGSCSLLCNTSSSASSPHWSQNPYPCKALRTALGQRRSRRGRKGQDDAFSRCGNQLCFLLCTWPTGRDSTKPLRTLCPLRTRCNAHPEACLGRISQRPHWSRIWQIMLMLMQSPANSQESQPLIAELFKLSMGQTRLKGFSKSAPGLGSQVLFNRSGPRTRTLTPEIVLSPSPYVRKPTPWTLNLER